MSFRRQPSLPSNKAQKMSLVNDEAAGHRVASSDYVHKVRYDSSLRDFQLLALNLWTHPHSSTQMKAMFPDMASMI